MAHERCFLCVFWGGSRCTHTFRMVFLVEPVGGQVEVQITPGMVPDELMITVSEYFQKFINRVIPAIETMPIWDEIREFQLAHPEREGCPARKEIEGIKPYLRIV